MSREIPIPVSVTRMTALSLTRSAVTSIFAALWSELESVTENVGQHLTQLYGVRPGYQRLATWRRRKPERFAGELWSQQAFYRRNHIAQVNRLQIDASLSCFDLREAKYIVV